MELVRDFLDALDGFLVPIREVGLEYGHQRIDNLRQGLVVLRLAAFVPADGPHRLLAGFGNVAKFRLQRIDFRLERLVLPRKCLNLLAANFDKLGVTLLFGIVQGFFA